MVKNLKKLRRRKGISQQKLADALGTSQQAINKYENQGSEPDIDMLIAMADFFNTSVDYLVGNTKDKKPDGKTKQDYQLNEREARLIDWYRGFDERYQSAFDMMACGDIDPDNFSTDEF